MIDSDFNRLVEFAKAEEWKLLCEYIDEQIDEELNALKTHPNSTNIDFHFWRGRSLLADKIKNLQKIDTSDKVEEDDDIGVL